MVRKKKFIGNKNDKWMILLEVPYPKELKTDYGFSHLPEKFNILVTLFNEMEKVLWFTYQIIFNLYNRYFHMAVGCLKH